MHLETSDCEKNIAYIKKRNPSLALQLSLADPSDLHFCYTQDKEISLCRYYQNCLYHYHSPKGAVQEANGWFSSLALQKTTTLIVYGVGLGYYYQAAQNWLRQDGSHSLVFLEEDLSVIYRLCETQLGSLLLRDPQVSLFYLQDAEINKVIFNELSWTYFRTIYVISSLKLYEEANPKGYQDLSREISYYFQRKELFINEYLQVGLPFYRNFYPNLLELPDSFAGNSLFGHFPQVPAIICGAGPSLDKNAHLLHDILDKALVFAGGSALPALLAKGIIPHFGVAADPNRTQYTRMAATSHISTLPIFYRNRLFHEALLAIKGPRLYLTGVGGYATSHWFEKKLDIDGKDLEEGHNVVNLAILIAQALGCHPIILVGLDLAFTDQQDYASGISDLLHLTEKNVDIQKDSVLREDSQGKPILTQWKWIIESQWISDFAKENPEITIINATEGGLGCKDVVNMPLKEALSQFVEKKRKEITNIHSLIKEHSFSHLTKEKILSLFLELENSLEQTTLLFSQFIAIIDQQIKQIEHKKIDVEQLETPEIAILENRIDEEIAYKHVLEIFNTVYIHLHHRRAQELTKPRLSKKKRVIGQLQLKRERFLFLQDVARLNKILLSRFVQENT